MIMMMGHMNVKIKFKLISHNTVLSVKYLSRKHFEGLASTPLVHVPAYMRLLGTY